MKSVRVAAVAAVLLATGCSGSGSSTRPLLPASSAASAELTLADMPAGWVASPDADTQDSKRGICNRPQPVEGYTKSAVGYSAPSGDFQFVTEVLRVYPSAASVSSDLDATAAAVEACSSFKQGGKTYRVTRQPSPSAGDRAVGLRVESPLTGRGAGAVFVADLLYIQRANVLIQVNSGGFGSTDPAVLADLARKAVARVDAAIAAGE